MKNIVYVLSLIIITVFVSSKPVKSTIDDGLNKFLNDNGVITISLINYKERKTEKEFTTIYSKKDIIVAHSIIYIDMAIQIDTMYIISNEKYNKFNSYNLLVMKDSPQLTAEDSIVVSGSRTDYSICVNNKLVKEFSNKRKYSFYKNMTN